jgi:hypothetical protein
MAPEEIRKKRLAQVKTRHRKDTITEGRMAGSFACHARPGNRPRAGFFASDADARRARIHGAGRAGDGRPQLLREQ